MLSEGQTLERKYKVGRLLGKGGMGAVFLGQHTLINRTVAIKVLYETDPESENVRRFEKEAQAAGRIGSDHIVEVLDVGTTPDGDRFMVMEFLDGESLKDRLKRGRLQPPEVVQLCTQLLEGLGAAHAAGIIHRDLKPDNVYILKEKAGRRDFVKIVDFGISKFEALEGGMTRTGAVMGTPFYMSPEQARAANEVDNRSDLYAVGVLMYEAVTAAVPFRGTTLTELLFKIVFDEAPHPCTLVPTLDPAFGALIMKSMARDPSDRFPNARAMQEALAAWREAPRVAAPPAGGAPLPLPPAAAGRPVANKGTAILEAYTGPGPGAAGHAVVPVAPPPPLAGPPPPLAAANGGGVAKTQALTMGLLPVSQEAVHAMGKAAPAGAPAADASGGKHTRPKSKWNERQGLPQTVPGGAPQNLLEAAAAEVPGRPAGVAAGSPTDAAKTLDPSPVPPQGRTKVVALAAVVLLGGAGAAAFFAMRAPAPPAPPAAATATVAATVAATAAPRPAAPSATAITTTAPAAATPTGEPSTASTSAPTVDAVHATGGRGVAPPRPTTAPPQQPNGSGKLKDLGY